ncbi:hypothetical protein WN55_08764 [Dufourea novaeangliae]|uniref:Uncharacterized protein n=1 Tax=Dufourea novaeangliae TaxID=178035 RepID=A0A154NZV8_DUFNO|nr:hypothetical protein WN55_08764 [Dufourea novaeangliae]
MTRTPPQISSALTLGSYEKGRVGRGTGSEGIGANRSGNDFRGLIKRMVFSRVASMLSLTGRRLNSLAAWANLEAWISHDMGNEAAVRVKTRGVRARRCYNTCDRVTGSPTTHR